MRVSVIIPTINEAANIVRSVQSAQSAGAGEVIVVDGGSNDATLTRAAEAGANVVASAPGRGRQQNLGAAQARGDILLFLHADSRLGPDCIHQIVQVLAKNQGTESAWGAFRQRIEADGLRYRWLEWGNACRVRRLGMPYGDQAIFLQRAVWNRLGGFPELPIMEDYLLAKRARKLSRPWLLPGPVFTSARRWIQHGFARQTLNNWLFVLATECGVSPHLLARRYRPHDESPTA